MSNSSFVVDTSKLASASDVVADDCGSWRNNGQHEFLFAKNIEASEDEPRLIHLDKTSDCKALEATLNRTYYINRSSPDYRKIISFVTGKFYLVFMCLISLTNSSSL